MLLVAILSVFHAIGQVPVTSTSSAFVGILITNGVQSIAGCSLTAASGSNSAGVFTSGTSGTCTATITMAMAATHGYVCWVKDETTPADLLSDTITSTTITTISGTTANGDVIHYGCIGQ